MQIISGQLRVRGIAGVFPMIEADYMVDDVIQFAESEAGMLY